MEVIEACLGILIVPPVAQRIDLRHGAAGTQDLAEGIVEIRCHLVAAAVYQIHHVALQIRNVIIDGAGRVYGVGQGVWGATLVIPEIQNLCGTVPRDRLPQQLPAGVDIAVLFCGGSLGNSPASPHTACVVGILPVVTCVAGRGQMLICGPVET